MLERYITVNMNYENKISEYEKENGEGSSKTSFVHQNGLVLLEKTLKGLPIELHIKSSLPDILKNNDATRLTPNGNRIIQLAFCDALLKVRKQWIEDPTNLQESNELRLVSFMINKATADFLNEIGFNAQSVKLEKTDYKEAPKIKQAKLTDEQYTDICERLEPYLFRYSVHKDSSGNITPTSQLGIATISKEDLISNEVVVKILKKRKELIDKLKEEKVDIEKIDEKLIAEIEDNQKSTEIDEKIVTEESDFKDCYGIDISSIKEMGDDKLTKEGVIGFARQNDIQMCKEDAENNINGLCRENSRDNKLID